MSQSQADTRSGLLGPCWRGLCAPALPPLAPACPEVWACLWGPHPGSVFPLPASSPQSCGQCLCPRESRGSTRIDQLSLPFIKWHFHKKCGVADLDTLCWILKDAPVFVASRLPVEGFTPQSSREEETGLYSLLLFYCTTPSCSCSGN